MKNFSYVK